MCRCTVILYNEVVGKLFMFVISFLLRSSTFFIEKNIPGSLIYKKILRRVFRKFFFLTNIQKNHKHSFALATDKDNGYVFLAHFLFKFPFFGRGYQRLGPLVVLHIFW